MKTLPTASTPRNTMPSTTVRAAAIRPAPMPWKPSPLRRPPPRIAGLMAILVCGGLWLSPGAAPLRAASPQAGDRAEPVTPSEWLNASGSPSWDAFRGRLILVEKWATWCGPCRQSIPHLNELHEKYSPKGLVIIGVSDEPAGTIKPFIQEMRMQYVVAVGGAGSYRTEGIPHAWLVSSRGSVLWEGHPLGLKEDQIVEGLKDVKLAPDVKLPKELSAAQRSFDSEKYGAAIRQLERKLKNPPSDEVARAAREAIEATKAYGESRLADAIALGKEGEYVGALSIVTGLEKTFGGHEIGDKAKAQRAAWLKEKAVKLELEARGQLEKAKDLLRQKKSREAAAILRALVGSKRYGETKAVALARKALEGIKEEA